MSGVTRPGAGQKREKPLTLAEIGRRIEALSGKRVTVGGHSLDVWWGTPSEAGQVSLWYTKEQALAYLNSLDRKGAA